jgi:hypothetical protein
MTFRGQRRVCLVREPDAGDLHVRFDERDVETELRHGYSGTASRKGRQQTTQTYCHRATSRLYRELSSLLLMPIVEVDLATQNIGLVSASEFGATTNLWCTDRCRGH